MRFLRRTFTFKFVSKSCDKTRTFNIRKLVSNEQIDNMTVQDMKNIFWDYAIENEVNVKNYEMIGVGVSYVE